MPRTTTPEQRLNEVMNTVDVDVDHFSRAWLGFKATCGEPETAFVVDQLKQGRVVRDAIKKALRALTEWETRRPAFAAPLATYPCSDVKEEDDHVDSTPRFMPQ